MATGDTIYKVRMSISDLDRHYYADHDLTIARHPSETDLRMMVRVCAFALNAHEHLAFTRGLCSEEEPDLWQADLGGDYTLWILLGQPEEKRIRKACGRAEKVIIYTYSEGAARNWWKQNEEKLRRFSNLKVIYLDAKGIDAIAKRTMQMQCTVQDGELMLHDEHESVSVTQERWK